MPTEADAFITRSIYLRESSIGSLAMLLATRRASSIVSTLAVSHAYSVLAGEERYKYGQ